MTNVQLGQSTTVVGDGGQLVIGQFGDGETVELVTHGEDGTADKGFDLNVFEGQ